jgi:hypothetical protein
VPHSAHIDGFNPKDGVPGVAISVLFLENQSPNLENIIAHLDFE